MAVDDMMVLAQALSLLLAFAARCQSRHHCHPRSSGGSAADALSGTTTEKSHKHKRGGGGHT